MKELTVKEMAAMGGHARAAQLTKRRLSEIGKKAIKTRWRKERANNQKEHKQWKQKRTKKH